jgi:hypothetical protein
MPELPDTEPFQEARIYSPDELMRVHFLTLRNMVIGVFDEYRLESPLALMEQDNFHFLNLIITKVSRINILRNLDDEHKEIIIHALIASLFEQSSIINFYNKVTDRFLKLEGNPLNKARKIFANRLLIGAFFILHHQLIALDPMDHTLPFRNEEFPYKKVPFLGKEVSSEVNPMNMVRIEYPFRPSYREEMPDLRSFYTLSLIDLMRDQTGTNVLKLQDEVDSMLQSEAITAPSLV